MKKLLVIFLFTMITYGQKSADAFLSSAPAIPSNSCNQTTKEKEEFGDKISTLLDDIKTEKERRKADFESSVDNQKLLDKNMPDGLKDMSEEELAKLENMSEAEQEAFAKKMMEKATKDPTSFTKKMTKEEFDKEKNDSDFQSNLMKTMGEYEVKFIEKLKKLNDDAEIFIFDKIKPVEKRLSESPDGESSTPAQIAEGKKLLAEIKALKEQYCSDFTPKYISLLDEYLTYVKKNMSEVRKSEQIAASKVEKESPDTMALDLVNGYIYYLKDLFQYDLIKHDPENH